MDLLVAKVELALLFYNATKLTINFINFLLQYDVSFTIKLQRDILHLIRTNLVEYNIVIRLNSCVMELQSF